MDSDLAAPDLDDVVRLARTAPGLLAKASIGLVGEVLGGVDWLAGPGDDGAVVADRGGNLVVGGEAIFPPFIAADPFGAGVAAVLTNVNDLAAMGAIPLAIVDTITGPREIARSVLEGMRWASELYDVPVVGGHLTVTDCAPALSAFGLGRAERPLSARNAAPGQTLMVACCLDGRMRADFPFFPSFDERGGRLAGDVRLLAEVARHGWAVAAKDVSMAGLLGSLGMLLECRGLGVTVDLGVLPVPAGVPLERWLGCFPCYAFLLCVQPGAERDCEDRFTRRGLVAAAVGTLDETGLLQVAAGGRARTVFDFSRESVTNLPPTAG
jgi:selenophosphate synthetase-related protein